MHHADAHGSGDLWVVDFNRSPAPQQLAVIRLLQAAKNFHQCRLAGAIFTEHRVYLRWVHRQIDILIGDNLAEPLVYAARFNEWSVFRHGW